MPLEATAEDKFTIGRVTINDPKGEGLHEGKVIAIIDKGQILL